MWASVPRARGPQWGNNRCITQPLVGRKTKRYTETSLSGIHPHKSPWQLQFSPRKRVKRKQDGKKGGMCLKKKCHSTSNNRATELEAAELIPHGLSHHNDYLFLTNGNSNLLILWLHFCGLTFHMSQETSASPPCLNPPRLNWSHVWHTNEKATCKHRAFDGLNSAYPRDKRKPNSRIFTCDFLPKMPP